MSATDIHHDALELLEQGQPLKALKAWRELLLADRDGVHLHLEAARQVLSADPLAPVRRRALELAEHLLQSDPGETEIHELGILLQHWGEICLPEVPSRALQHFERAWSCGANTRLDEQLSCLYARLGFGTGAYARAKPPAEPAPWPHTPCTAQNCRQTACSTARNEQYPMEQPLTLNLFEQGRIWIQRQSNPWRHTHGIGVQNNSGDFARQLCRHYPWPWPHCPHHDHFRRLALAQLEQQRASQPPAWIAEHPVLAVGELSGEMFFHWQLEVLPRLGRCWAAALELWPELRVWHNGRNTPWVQESLKRLGIPEDRILPDVEHLQASLLIVPSFSGPFGQPSAANLSWLESFWDLTTTHPGKGEQIPLWLGRSGSVHRPVLGLHDSTNRLRRSTAISLEQQWREMQTADHVIAAHGAAMTRLLGCRNSIALTELVNPDYHPPYFKTLVARRKLQYQCLEAAPTPLPLQEWLYEGPTAFPIDLRPGLSVAAEALHD